jgi:hypothetical protein
MTYLDQWHAIASRIRGLMQTGDLLAAGVNDRSGTAKECAKYLRGHLEAVVDTLDEFREAFKETLPPATEMALGSFIEGVRPHVAPPKNETSDTIYRHVWTALVQLAAFESELMFLFSETQEPLRTRSERAFIHLRRSIAVDSDLRSRWQAALDQGEHTCERLGSVHLLLHGIWAFKVDAIGARTDLLIEEPNGDQLSPERFSDGLVLTEWKKAINESGANAAFEAARSQARRYKEGALAATELRRYRYAVVVSKHQVPVPADVVEDDVVYRHVNIPVDPRVPSDPRSP